FLTVNAMKHYERYTEFLAVLSVFIPMIISTGGNSGSQAAAMIIRGIAVHEIHLRDWFRVFLRELRISLMLGLFLGVLASGYAYFVFDREVEAAPGTDAVVLTQETEETGMGSPIVNVVKIQALVLLSITGIVTLGTLIGSMLPFLFKRIGLDPAVCSGPFIATFVDVSGIIVYFSVAQLLIPPLANQLNLG